MKNHLIFKMNIIFFLCFIMGGMNALATEPNAIDEMPKSCQRIAPEKLIFDLPLYTQELTQSQQIQIRAIIDDARMQACILQMQYDGLLQQIIALLFENSEDISEQLKPFYDQLSSVVQSRTENKLKAVASIRKLLSEKEWQNGIIAYARFITSKNEYIKQQIALQQFSEKLMMGNNSPNAQIIFAVPQFYCVINNSKIQILVQIILTLSSTYIQERDFANSVRRYNIESCHILRDKYQYVEQFLKMMTTSGVEVDEQQRQTILKQLAIKEYLLEINQIQTISSLFQMLTQAQKNQLREKYMLLKNIL
ncbi:hypothetical protein [Commensalibacter nepenthis]|uniref:Secreted protein n=1 Tax=Commensalibacter nepenthis TaxID=3043872 RepID=A0ABT6Q974_9PROT|nr:hypothetical protein [Commensalibacter sp. TBRC 10068]MDI2113451.1 hypothetical protein [Commensalibacter sp. TBRC 10068]